ncbi:MAG: PAS domain S-box protein [Spirochaetaceae bacterium]
MFRLLHRAVEEAGHAVFITTPEGVIRYVNPAFERMTGYSREEALGSTPRLLSSGEMSRDYFARLWETISSGNTWREEIRNRRKDGALYYATQTISPVLAESGTVEWYVAVQSDETDLMRREEQYRLLAENATDLIARHDTDGRFLYASPACRHLLGYEPSELIGVDPFALFHPEDRKREGGPRDFSEGNPGTRYLTYRIRRKDGSYTWFETASTPMSDPETGAVTEVITVSRDVSDRVAMEQRLRQARKEAEAASRTKSEFVANVSHELRTPLHAILGFGELLRRIVDDETGQRYLATINESARTLLDLINDLLDLSRVEAGLLKLTRAFADPQRIVSGVLTMFEPHTEKKAVELKSTVDPEVPPNLYVDSARLRQVLLNLTSNAVKFTDEGTVVVSLSGEAREPDRFDLVMTVSDTGPGIPESEQERLFEAFSQAHGAESANRGGTGLGLAITKRLVELMDGTIEMESREGAGTRFTVRVPSLPARWDVSEPRTPEEERGEDRPVEKVHSREPANFEPAEGVSVSPRQAERVREELQQRLGASWRRIRHVKMLDELAEFGTEVESFGAEHGLEGFEEAGRRIARSAQQFDVAATEEALESFRRRAESFGATLHEETE